MSLTFQRLRNTGREGDVALGLTNDLDTAVGISLTSSEAFKGHWLSIRIHMVPVQPTARIHFDWSPQTHALFLVQDSGERFPFKLGVCYSAQGQKISLHVMSRLQVLTTANGTID